MYNIKKKSMRIHELNKLFLQPTFLYTTNLYDGSSRNQRKPYVFHNHITSWLHVNTEIWVSKSI